MLVNESTLRAVVRKYLLEAISADMIASDFGGFAADVSGLSPILGDAMTRKTACENFMSVRPGWTSHTPRSMIYNRKIDGSNQPKDSIYYLYNYVNLTNFQDVYKTIIEILKKHANDLNVDAGEVEELYGKPLTRSLTNASRTVFTSAQPLPQNLATATGLPVKPVAPGDQAIVDKNMSTINAAVAQAMAGSLPNALQAFFNFTTLPQHAFATYDWSKLNNTRQEAAQPGATVDSIVELLVGAAILSIDKTKFQNFATQYLKSYVSVGIEQTNKWAENYILTTDLLKSGTTPTAPGVAPVPGPTTAAVPATAPAAAAAPAAKPKPKPAGDWNSYVRMTRGGQGAAVQQAWETNAAKFGSDVSYPSFVKWYRTQMKSNGGRHLSPDVIIRLLQQPTPAAPAAATPVATPATPTPVATPATPTPVAAQTPAAPAASQTPQSNWWTDSLRNRSARAADRADRQSARADRTDTRRAKRKANK